MMNFQLRGAKNFLPLEFVNSSRQVQLRFRAAEIRSLLETRPRRSKRRVIWPRLSDPQSPIRNLEHRFLNILINRDRLE
jgi:hypothetical protein